MIRFDHVSKSYKGTPRPALDDITTEILRGEFVFVVGASGSGKSTFLRLILREEKVTRGRLHVLGQDLSSISHRKVPYFRRNVGVVFQDFRLLTNKNVFDNVAFTLKVIGKSKGFIHEAVPDVLAMVGLEGKAQRLPHELSGGEQQRVAIARAVVNKPQILLADEPTGNLDPTTSAGITAVLERINAAGTTVLMATHEAGLVDRMQKRVIELVDGRLVRDERHGGYGVTAAIPVLGAREQEAEIPAGYGGIPASAAGAEAGVAASAAHADVRAGGRSRRAERRARKRAAEDAPTAAPQPPLTVGTASRPAPVEEAVPVPSSPPIPSAAAAAARGGEAETVPSGRGEPVPASVSSPASARSGSALDGHFANPPTAPVRRTDSSEVAELTLAERLGLRAPGRSGQEEDPNQDVGPVS